MKTKLILTICLINILSVSCLAISRNSTSAEKIEYIKKASIKTQVKRMENTWESLCEKDPKTCTEKQEWFDDLLYNTKVRKHDIQSIMLNMPQSK
jgi:lipoprotein